MGRSTKNSLPFDKKGGVIAIMRRLVDSESFLSLSSQAKSLMLLMHVHWRNYEPVAYGIREAEKKIPCCKRTAQKAFGELIERGFIDLVDESLFNSRVGSRSRTWKLNWLPYQSLPPTNDWEKTTLSG
jgi:hypothetical protein